MTSRAASILGLLLLVAIGYPDAPAGQEKNPSDAPALPNFYGYDVTPPRTSPGRGRAPKGCAVLNASLKYGQAVDDPLTFPADYSAPSPKVPPGSHTAGASIGPIPGTTPALAFTGNAFEYHSEVKGMGCTSKQFVRYFIVTMEQSTGKIRSYEGNGITDRSTWQEDRLAPKDPRTPSRPPPRSLFDGGTSSGDLKSKNRDGSEFIYYRGTPSVIEWVDTPGLVANVPPQGSATGVPLAQVLVAVIVSITYDGGSQNHGWSCYSGHTAVADLTTGMAMEPSAVSKMFAQARPQKNLQAWKDAAEGLKAPAPPAKTGYGGNDNPEFRNLGCKAF